jgi:hypothetical protein
LNPPCDSLSQRACWKEYIPSVEFLSISIILFIITDFERELKETPHERKKTDKNLTMTYADFKKIQQEKQNKK